MAKEKKEGEEKFRRLKAFANHPWVNLLSGIVLFLTAVQEIVDRLGEDGFHLGHGLALFAALQILRVLPHVVEGAESVTKATEE